MNLNNLRMSLKAALDNLWARITSMFSGLDDRVTALEQGGGGDVNVIEAISFNGTNVPPDGNKRVSMSESDPTVPIWAKQSSKPTYTAQEVGALPDTTTFVSGVKGNEESSYRSGNVNLTPANVGALPKGNFSMSAAQEGGLIRETKGTDITQSDNGITDAVKRGTILALTDGNGINHFRAYSEIYKSGIIKYGFSAWNLNNPGTGITNFYGNVQIAKDGTVICELSHPEQIKQALGIVEATQSAAGLMSATDKAKLDGIVLMPSSSVPIPASGSSASYNMTGLTSDHQLVRWNFSASAENAPPASLSWNTYSGYFTITNDGGTTSESMQPVFALPKAVAITSR